MKRELTWHKYLQPWVATCHLPRGGLVVYRPFIHARIMLYLRACCVQCATSLLRECFHWRWTCVAILLALLLDCGFLCMLLRDDWCLTSFYRVVTYPVWQHHGHTSSCQRWLLDLTHLVWGSLFLGYHIGKTFAIDPRDWRHLGLLPQSAPGKSNRTVFLCLQLCDDLGISPPMSVMPLLVAAPWACADHAIAMTLSLWWISSLAVWPSFNLLQLLRCSLLTVAAGDRVHSGRPCRSGSSRLWYLELRDQVERIGVFCSFYVWRFSVSN